MMAASCLARRTDYSWLITVASEGKGLLTNDGGEKKILCDYDICPHLIELS